MHVTLRGSSLTLFGLFKAVVYSGKRQKPSKDGKKGVEPDEIIGYLCILPLGTSMFSYASKITVSQTVLNIDGLPKRH